VYATARRNARRFKESNSPTDMTVVPTTNMTVCRVVGALKVSDSINYTIYFP